VADQFSGWPQVFPFPDTNMSTRRVIDTLRSFFTCGAGAPVKLWSDGGPQFKSDEFLAFLRDWDISNGRSSPHHPQSNGYAESAVKSMKKLIAGSWSSGSFDPDTFGKALLLFRNAPMSGGASPSQIVFSRPTRDLLPAHRRSFAPEWQQAAELLEKRAQRAKELQIQHFNRTAHPLPPLVIGDSVLIQDHKSKRWSTPGVIVEVGPFRITSSKRQLVGCSAAIGVFFVSSPPKFRGHSHQRALQLRLPPSSCLVRPLRQRLHPLSVVRVAWPPRSLRELIFCLFVCLSLSSVLI
jgi:hypothetical protein